MDSRQKGRELFSQKKTGENRYNVKKIIIFGAGPTGKRAYEFYREFCNVIAFADNNTLLYGTDINGVQIIPAEQIIDYDYDYIIIASVPGYDAICQQLERYGIEQDKVKRFVSGTNKNRELSFYQYAKELKNISGACAEVGVFQGDTAKIINRAFADRILYLFDTFSGFDERDVEEEERNGFSAAKTGDYQDTTVERVLQKMEFPEQCVIKKGYFPETAEGLEETFAFVRLDVDMYKPTKAGLEWFGERMAKGGFLISHDYYTESYGGVAQAIDEYVNEHPTLHRIPVGDGLSVMLVGF